MDDQKNSPFGGKLFNMSQQIKLPKIDTESLRNPSIDHTSLQRAVKAVEQAQEEKRRAIEAEKKEQVEFRQSILETLVNIEKNTAEISTIVALINQSNENQEQILEIITDIMAISSAKDEKEADSKYRAVIGKAHQVVQDVETVNKIIRFGEVVWISAKNLIKMHHLGS